MFRQQAFTRYKLHHILFWILVFVCWFYFRYQDYATRAIAFKITFVKVVALASAIYLVNFYLISAFLYKKRYIVFIGLFVAVILLSGLMKMFIMGEITGETVESSPFSNLKVKFYENVISDFFLITSGAAFKLIFDYMEMQQRLAVIAREKAETELSFLKSQINPHFLFNSLNAVYFLIHKDNAEARQALHKFSEMLRYQLYEGKGEKISIEKELAYLRDYVDMQTLRKNENFCVDFHCSPEVKEFSIEALLLLPFVENAFKHISHYNGLVNYVRLDMSRNDGNFVFSIENSRDAGRSREGTGGIGMSNVKRRLELLYPGMHRLDIWDEDGYYRVRLELKIAE